MRGLVDLHSALLIAPSDVVSRTDNVLLNPARPDAARLTIVRVSEHALDPQLMR
jgi:hypothetical protein